ncbi:MAG: DNA repair exonuclease [Armatimonadetes bacterium]|nr:DNA repair exonuclease [Armatimonadota bacterium]
MDKLRLVHTADVHLGRSSTAFGPAAREHRQRLQQAFERCVACCTEQGVQLLVIAGDLFDSPRPPESAAEFARAQLVRLTTQSPAVSTVLAPGTHDPVQPGSIYQRWQAQGLPSGVHLLSAEQPTVNLAELDVAVTFGENTGDLRPDPAARWNIGVIHGSVQIPGLVDDDSVIFTQDQLAATGMDYVALGHWHSFGEYSQGGVVALYPGSPEIVGLDQAEQGQVLVVDLDDEGHCTWEQVATGTLQYHQQDLDLADFANLEELIQSILELADGDTILDTRLVGIAPEQMVVDHDRILERVEEQFFRIRLTDESYADWDETGPEPSGLVAGRFRELMKERFAAAETDEQRQVVQQARSLGLALLAGKEVLG